MTPRPGPWLPQEGQRRRWSWRVYLATAGTDKATFTRAWFCEGGRYRLQGPPPEEEPLPYVCPLPENPRPSWGISRAAVPGEPPLPH